MNAQADENEAALPTDSGFFREGAAPHSNYPNKKIRLPNHARPPAGLHLQHRKEFYP